MRVGVIPPNCTRRLQSERWEDAFVAPQPIASMQISRVPNPRRSREGLARSAELRYLTPPQKPLQRTWADAVEFSVSNSFLCWGSPSYRVHVPFFALSFVAGLICFCLLIHPPPLNSLVCSFLEVRSPLCGTFRHPRLFFTHSHSSDKSSDKIYRQLE